MIKPGPIARTQLLKLATTWKQGEHLLITGGTGSGKTVLARFLDEIRLRNGGAVVVFVAKMQPDKTITEMYRGWTRWKTWKDKPNVTEDRILFWPDVKGMNATQAAAHMRKEMKHALEQISKTGKWTVHLDEGLFTTSAQGLNLGALVSTMFQLFRSSKGTLIILAQRPALLPLSIYANIDHAFIGRANEPADLKRLANMDATIPAKEMQALIRKNTKHDFIWVRMGSDNEPERINLAK